MWGSKGLCGKGAACRKPELFGSGAVGAKLLAGDVVDAIGHGHEVLRDRRERGGALETALIHVERPVDLELYRMQPGGRGAVVLGDETAGIGLVAAHHLAALPQDR